MHENLSKMQGQTQRGKEVLNKQQQNPFLRMDISFSQQGGSMYFTDQNFAKIPLLLLKHNDEHQNPDNNYTHDPKPGPPQPMGSTSNIRPTTTEPSPQATRVGGIILVPNLLFTLDSFVVNTKLFSLQ